MKTIYKYNVHISHGIINMPIGAKPLSVGKQVDPPGSPDNLVMWALVDPDAPIGQFEFWALWTGEPYDVPAGATFLGTVQIGPIVHHVFYRDRTATIYIDGKV